ncbi:MAG: hypothetical protein DYG90_01285, partial [Chloroflexi bacterium CFX6]|nr:hypothetical protein [Chloroflexi bacterium CFX6]
PPGLAVPTAQRTLRPLAYEAPLGADGLPDERAPADAWRVRAPEAILGLRVCDPAMGSGSFLVAGLRFLTDALFESLHAHDRLAPLPDGRGRTMPLGLPETGGLGEERMPALDGPEGESTLRARLKRYVVERCIYGVDVDPLAVELARLALWVETMDRSLPFGFLDHKLKAGNALVGCWFDRFRDYPALAWEREGGDKRHAGVHFGKEVWTRAIKAFRNERVKEELPRWITGQRHFLDVVDGAAPEALHAALRAGLEGVHGVGLADPERQADAYRALVEGRGYLALKAAFDTWCACWFWPADDLASAPSPESFERPSAATAAGVAALARRHGFFHWELEFPDVFAAEGSGFDAVIGNPPWEIQKPNSKEFFSNLDPLYRSYGKQEALRRQREIFAASAADERAWLAYNARFKALSSWSQHAGRPFGDGADGEGRFNLGKGGEGVHAVWRHRRAGWVSYADAEHPFRHQGAADINTYKMFIEQGRALLRDDGRLGLVVPSGLYTDKGATALRVLLLDRSRWQWLFGFENRDGIFGIHRSFKFCPIIVQKGGATRAVTAAFMRHDLADWENAERHVIPYGRAQVDRFSPRTQAILEIRGERDIAILEKIYTGTVLLGDDGPEGWGIRYATEFHMTNDSHLFPPRPQWEAKGYRPDEYGRWVGPRGDVALPLYEGRMIGQFDFSDKGWVSGKGRTAVWREIPWGAKVVEPQYLMGLASARGSKKSYLHPKLAYMRISSATNSRTTIATYLDSLPAGDSVFFFRSRTHSSSDCLSLVGVLNSIVFDFQARGRLGGLNMSEFVMVETALPPRSVFVGIRDIWLAAVAQLATPNDQFAPMWLRLQSLWQRFDGKRSWRRLWAITPHERLRLRAMLDAVVAELYGLDWDDFAYILRDCDHPAAAMRQSAFTRALDPKGFWRVDKTQDPELRHTVLSLVAFHDLKGAIARAGDRHGGIDAFCRQHDGDGWMLPETLRLADLGLGHDDRAGVAQPVRARLGERFLPWQLEQTAEESWAECERHARNILGETEFRRLQRELAGEQREERRVAEERAQYEAGKQRGLWED